MIEYQPFSVITRDPESLSVSVHHVLSSSIENAFYQASCDCYLQPVDWVCTIPGHIRDREDMLCADDEPEYINHCDEPYESMVNIGEFETYAQAYDIACLLHAEYSINARGDKKFQLWVSKSNICAANICRVLLGVTQLSETAHPLLDDNQRFTQDWLAYIRKGDHMDKFTEWLTSSFAVNAESLLRSNYVQANSR